MNIKAKRLMHELQTMEPKYEDVIIVGFTEKTNGHVGNPSQTFAVYINQKKHIYCDRLGYFIADTEEIHSSNL